MAGGEVSLDVEAAGRAIESTAAVSLGVSVKDAAAAIVEVVENNMAAAIRTVSIGRGHDPKEFALIAFGGAGPLHACMLAALLGIRTVVIPPSPGVLSTNGLLFTDLRNDYVQTFTGDLDQLNCQQMGAAFASLEAAAHAWLQEQGIQPERREIKRFADFRYRNQGWELTVPVPDGQLSPETVAGALQEFHDLHRRLYTYDMRQTPVQLVNLRVSAVGHLPHPRAAEVAPSGDKPTAVSHRLVTFKRGEAQLDTPVYQRAQLKAGARFVGPAVVEQSDTTTLVWPHFTASVDPFGNIVIEAAGLGGSK
jgi:N-methylhydantoinase A